MFDDLSFVLKVCCIACRRYLGHPGESVDRSHRLRSKRRSRFGTPGQLLDAHRHLLNGGRTVREALAVNLDALFVGSGKFLFGRILSFCTHGIAAIQEFSEPAKQDVWAHQHIYSLYRFSHCIWPVPMSVTTQHCHGLRGTKPLWRQARSTRNLQWRSEIHYVLIKLPITFP